MQRLAYAELEQGAAIAALQAAVAADLELVEAHPRLVVLVQQQGRIAESFGHHVVLALLQPGSLGPRIESALPLKRAGDAEGCVRQLEAMLAGAPRAPLLKEAFQLVASTAPAGAGWSGSGRWLLPPGSRRWRGCFPMEPIWRRLWVMPWWRWWTGLQGPPAWPARAASHSVHPTGCAH